MIGITSERSLLRERERKVIAGILLLTGHDHWFKDTDLITPVKGRHCIRSGEKQGKEISAICIRCCVGKTDPITGTGNQGAGEGGDPVVCINGPGDTTARSTQDKILAGRLGV